MTTPRQIEANRRNAKRSSGPKTALGKAAAARNALQHGLLAKRAMLPGESLWDFSVLSQKLHEELKPVGEFECALVGRIGSLLWRLKRMGKIEAGVLLWQRANVDPATTGRSEALARAYTSDRSLMEDGEAYIRSEDSLAKLSRYETSLEKSLFKTHQELQRLQAARIAEHARAPLVLEIDATKNQQPASEEETSEDGW